MVMVKLLKIYCTRKMENTITNPVRKTTSVDFLTRHFEQMTPFRRQLHLAHYTKLIDIEEGRLISKLMVTGKIFYYQKMPWMFVSWKEGLSILKEVMIAKG